MRTIARYFSIILIVGILLGSTGCYPLRYHDRQEHRDNRNNHDDSNYRGDRDDHGDRDDRR